MAHSHTKMVPVAVFDISSSSVAGAHTLIPKAGAEETKVSILASTRLLSEPREGLDIERFVENTIAGLEKAIVTLKKADNHTPGHIFVLLASPWFVSQTRTIVYNKTTDFVCTEKFVDELIDKEIAYVLEHDMERFGSMGGEGLIIEKQVSMIKLNGYSTNNPFGKKAQSLELFLVVTVSPKVVVERFKDLFHKAYAETPVHFSTSPFATFVVARDFLQAPKELMVVDIGEETTDIACIKDELFLYQHSFPVGFYQLYRALVANGHASLTEARGLIESFRLGKLSSTMTSTIQKAWDDFSASWITALHETLGTNGNTIKLPGTCYIISDQRFDTLFNAVLKNDPFFQHATGVVEYTPTTITAELLATHVASLDPERIDETIIVASLFASRLL